MTVVNQIRHSEGTENSIAEFSRVLNPKGLLELENAFTENRLVAKVLSSMAVFLRIVIPEIGNFCHVNQTKEFLGENGFTDVEAIKLRPTIVPFLFGYLYKFLAERI